MGRANAGYALIVIGVMVCLVGIFVGGKSAEERISDRFPSASGAVSATQASNGIDRRWNCGDRDPIEVGRELREEIRPQAYNEDDGAAYLRTQKYLFIVSRQVPEAGAKDTCLITRESLGGRYSSGHFIYLGPGFGPSAPSGGSGGSAGSYGGAK
ncbi:DUF4247 domain-containing protein [uncultured Corynebacterium sp.]|uniref:DUF4247 domain-containing protein n=1 Tax=uncultured Corynebacterium sp. TaxID=159447 RepID=UPI00260BD84D|nr:DUF4247 domain-containing protein [uncultured Corynebacterium sp.]